MLLTKAQIQSVKDIKTRTVSVPEWAPDGTPPEEAAKCEVMIRMLSGDQRWHWDEQGAQAQKDGYEVRPNGAAHMAILCCCNADLTPLFTQADLPWLRDKSSNALERIWREAVDLNFASAKAVEELKNGSPPSENSGSSSGDSTASSPGGSAS